MQREVRSYRNIIIGLYSSLILMSIVFIIYIAEVIITINQDVQLDKTAGITSSPISIILQIGIFIIPSLVAIPLFVIATGLSLRIFIKFDRARQEAARGSASQVALESAMEASVDTEAHDAALTPPVVLWHGTPRRPLIAISVAFIVFNIIFTPLVVYFIRLGDIPSDSILTVVQELTFAVWLFANFGFIGYLFIKSVFNQRLIIDDEGQRIVLVGRKVTVRWDEARLFARLNHDRFELSSPTTIVRWTRWPHDSSQATNPAGEDYQAQMDALLRTIAARTGLPLMDLRAVSPL